MKSRFSSVLVIISLLLLFTGIGFCQEKISASEWVDKVSQGNINWSAGYIEAVGVGAPPEGSMGKPNARPMALRAAEVVAKRNLLEITKGVQIDSRTTVKDFTVESDDINTQVTGLVKGAVVMDQQYKSDGTVEVTVRMPLYGNLTQIIMSSPMAQPPVALPVPSVSERPAPAIAVPAVIAPAAPPAHITYTGIIVDARGFQAHPAMSPRIFDEDGKEVYGFAKVDPKYAIQQGVSGYARDLTAARSNQRVTANPITVKAVEISAPGKSDIIISNADAQKIRTSAENMNFIKKCRVMIVLD
jgi:hypothetical protein